MTELLEQQTGLAAEPKTIEKVSIIVSKGSLEGVYPGLIMANGARMEGIEANLFFTFFGMDAIRKDRHDHIKAATVGNPGMHLPTWLGGLPGMCAIVTRMRSGRWRSSTSRRSRVHRADLRLRRASTPARPPSTCSS